MQVPTYDNLTQQLDPAQAPRVAPVGVGDAFVALGAATQQSAATFGNIVADQQHELNADAVLKAETSLKTDYLKFQQSLQDRRGQNAWGVTQDVSDWFDKQQKQYGDALSNPEQQKAFSASFNQLRESGLSSAGQFEAQQRHASLEESGKASISASINIAAADHNNDATILGAKQDIAKRIQLLGQMNGWTPEVQQAELGQYITDLHKQVIQARIDEDPASAQAYYDANKNEIDGSQRDAIDKLLKHGTDRELAQKGAATIIGQGLSEAESLAAARKNYTGEVQDGVVQRVKEQFSEQEVASQRDQKQASDQAWQAFDKSGSLSVIPTTVLNRMDGRDRNSLQKEADARLNGKEVPTNWEAYYGLRMLATQQPSEFANVDLRRYFGDLAPAQREQMINLQQDVKKGGGAADVQSFEAQLEHANGIMGLGSSDQDKKGAFASAVDTELSALSKQLGRKPTFDERQKVIDRMVIKGSTGGLFSFFGLGQKPFYTIAGTEDAAQFVPTIPDTEKASIVAALKRANKPTDDTSVMNLFKLRHGLQ